VAGTAGGLQERYAQQVGPQSWLDGAPLRLACRLQLVIDPWLMS
jgi:hypothetical protein